MSFCRRTVRLFSFPRTSQASPYQWKTAFAVREHGRMTQSSEILAVGDLLELLNTAKQLASEVSFPELLDAILARAQQLTDAPDASIFLYDSKSESLYFAAATGEKGPMLVREFGEFSDKRIPLHSKAGTVFSTGKSIIVDSLEQDPEH